MQHLVNVHVIQETEFDSQAFINWNIRAFLIEYPVKS